MIGQTISHYKILEQLGAGGMAVVYLAEDLKLNRKVVLKILPVESSRNQESRERFVREARAASALDHPNICTIYEIDESETGQMFIVMAYYRGETLERKIHPIPLQMNEALNIAVQIAQGLSAAHAANIIHRDIKPSNIIITDGDVKIIDFGLAKLMGQSKLTLSGATLGTLAYMSPEQLRGDPVDYRSDIFSFGVVLHEMLTGRHPFGENDQAVAYSIVNKEPESIRDFKTELPGELEQIVNKALKKVPDERYQNLDEMLADLVSIDKNLEADSTISTSQKIKGKSISIKKPNKLVSSFLIFMLYYGPLLALVFLFIDTLLLGWFPKDVKLHSLWSLRLLLVNWFETSFDIAQPAATHWAGGITDFPVIIIHLLCALQIWFTKGLWQAESSSGTAHYSIRGFLRWRKDGWTFVGLIAMLAAIALTIYHQFLPDTTCHVFGPTAKGLIANYRPDIPYAPEERFFLVLHRFLQLISLSLFLLTSAYVLPAYLRSSLSRPLIGNADDKQLRVEIIRTISIPIFGIGIVLILSLMTAELGIDELSGRSQHSAAIAMFILLFWLASGLFRLVRVERKDLDFFIWLDRIVQRLRAVSNKLFRQFLTIGGVVLFFVLIIPRLMRMMPGLAMIDLPMLELEAIVRNNIMDFCAWNMKKERDLYSYVSQQIDNATAGKVALHSEGSRQILESQVIAQATVIALFNYDVPFSRIIRAKPDSTQWLKNATVEEILNEIAPLARSFDHLPVPFFYDADYLAAHRRISAYRLLEYFKSNRISLRPPAHSDFEISSEQIWEMAQLAYRKHLSDLHLLDK